MWAVLRQNDDGHLTFTDTFPHHSAAKIVDFGKKTRNRHNLLYFPKLKGKNAAKLINKDVFLISHRKFNKGSRNSTN